MSKRRYNEQQIGAILQRSGEIQAGMSPDADSQGVTLEELQKVALEVGIEPHVVERAALEVDSGAKEEFTGTKILDHTVDGSITEEQWEDMVISLRQYAGKPGTTTLQGSTREWSSDSEMGSLTLSAATRNNRTRFRLLGDTTGIASLSWVLGLAFGFVGVIMLSAMLGKKTGMEAWLIAVIAAITSSVVVILTAIVAKSWQKKTQRALGKLFTSIIETATVTPPLLASTLVMVDEEAIQTTEA